MADKRIKANKEPTKLAGLTVKADSRPSRLTRKAALLKNAQNLLVTCPKTGISSLMILPAIPGMTLINEHPLAQIDNARGLAQRGKSYLKQLDSTVLAGLFISLATDYELLSTGAKWHAMQANATLRPVGTDALIEGILLIEQWIHSNNAIYLPRLSLEPSLDETVQGMNGRIVNWLRLLHDSIMAPDKTVFDPNQKPEKIIFESVQKISTKNRAKAKEITLERKALSGAKKILKAETPKLKSATSKLRNYLLTLSTGDMLVNADPGMLILLIGKLKDAKEQDSANQIIHCLNLEFPNLRAEQNNSDPFEDEEPEDDLTKANLTSMLGHSIREATVTASSDTNDSASLSDSDNSVENSEDEPEPDYANMTPIQAIIAKKAWQRRTGRSASMPFKTAAEEQAKFSIPSGQIIGAAPVYQPSAAKEKLAKSAERDTLPTPSLNNANPAQTQIEQTEIEDQDDSSEAEMTPLDGILKFKD